MLRLACVVCESVWRRRRLSDPFSPAVRSFGTENTMGRDDASQHGANEEHSCRPRSSPEGDKVSEPQHASPPYCQGDGQTTREGQRGRGEAGRERKRGRNVYRERKDENKQLNA